MTRVLVVDDEATIRRTLDEHLRARGYRVDIAADGETALELAAANRPDVVILDLGLPGIDGVEVVRGLRAWSTMPILVLSVRNSETDKISALDAGADDYVTKPFSMGELLARLRAAERRSAVTTEDPVVETRDFRIDLGAHTVTAGPDAVHLTSTEWRIVEVLSRNVGRLVTHRQLLQEVWGPEYRTEVNYLRVYVAAIRRKLEPDPSRPRYFVTDTGMGYRFITGDEKS